MLRCNIPGCSKECKTEPGMKVHKKKIHSIEPEPHICKECGKQWDTNLALVKHVFVHKPQPILLCTEPGCFNKYHKIDKLMQYKGKHEQERLRQKRKHELEQSLSRCEPENYEITWEMVPFLRYNKFDLELSWGEVVRRFKIRYPESSHSLKSLDQLLCMDSYESIYKPYTKFPPCPDSPALARTDFPNDLIIRNPELAIKLEFVDKEHKEIAHDIMIGKKFLYGTNHLLTNSNQLLIFKMST